MTSVNLLLTKLSTSVSESTQTLMFRRLQVHNMRFKIMLIKLLLTHIYCFKVVETRLVDGHGKILSIALTNDYNTQSGRHFNYPHLSLSLADDGLFRLSVYQQSPATENGNELYSSRRFFDLLPYWKKAYNHYLSTRKNLKTLSS